MRSTETRVSPGCWGRVYAYKGIVSFKFRNVGEAIIVEGGENREGNAYVDRHSRVITLEGGVLSTLSTK